MKIIGVVPARYASSRFPGKPLSDIHGKPMIWWVYHQAIQVREFDQVFVATDDERIFSECERLDIRAIMTGTTPVEPGYSVAENLTFNLKSNYPNPFNPSTTTQITLPSRAYIELDIFDLMGRHVVSLYEGTRNAGLHEFVWIADDKPSGIYWLRLTDGVSTASKKMILLK